MACCIGHRRMTQLTPLRRSTRQQVSAQRDILDRSRAVWRTEGLGTDEDQHHRITSEASVRNLERDLLGCRSAQRAEGSVVRTAARAVRSSPTSARELALDQVIESMVAHPTGANPDTVVETWAVLRSLEVDRTCVVRPAAERLAGTGSPGPARVRSSRAARQGALAKITAQWSTRRCSSGSSTTCGPTPSRAKSSA